MTEKKKPEADQKVDPAQVQTEEAVAGDQDPALATVGDAEVAMMELLAEFRRPHVRGRYDQRLVAIATTQIELGFLALFKAMTLAMNSEQKVEG